jgi:hypothetical protein
MNIPSWLASSANPENVSLFLKGLAAVAVLLGVDNTIVASIQNDILTIITNGGIVIAAAVSIWGAMRKISLGRWSAPKY